MTRPRRSRVLAALVVGVLVGTLVEASTVEAVSPADQSIQRVTLALAPQDPAGLKALAHATGLSRAQRAAALSNVVPSAQSRTDVVSAARQLGLKIDRASTWAVQVTGTATQIRQLFGSARANQPRSRFAHNLPAVPAAFGRKVTAAFGGDETRPAFRHLGSGTSGTWNGTDFRAQYGAANGPVGGVQTVATVQLSDWNSADLSTYASAAGLPAPQYTGIKDPFFPPVIDGSGGDLEVNLDQETILSVFPSARQRAYLAENSFAGMYDNLAAIGADASDPTVDHHITTASISWGACESPDPTAASMYDAFESVLQFVVASGVTIFASSGDDGTVCDPTTAPPTVGVSYPASSPEVIAVGGTQPTNSAASPPTTEQMWSDALGSSGGGTSSLFFRPTWQTGSGTMRDVPDIAALAGEPRFATYVSDPAYSAAPGFPWLRVEGTSLASPAMAALLAYELGKHNYSWGVGDVHADLYANPGDFTDITLGDSRIAVGYDTATGLGTPNWDSLVTKLQGDPHLTVPTFYTNSLRPAVTVQVPDFRPSPPSPLYSMYRLAIDSNAQCAPYGMTSTKPTLADFVAEYPGAPAHYWDGVNSLTLVALDGQSHCHFANSAVFIDTQRPTAKASIGLTTPTSGAKVTARWSFGDAAPSSGLGHFAVTIKNQKGATVYSAPNTVAASATIASLQGYTYTVQVVAYDKAGNRSAVSAASLTVPIDTRHFAFSRGWTRLYTSADYAGTDVASARKGSYSYLNATGRRYVLWFVTSRYGGKANVYVGNTLVKTIDLYSATTRRNVAVTVYTSATRATRRITVTVSGAKNRFSRGYNVNVLALQAIW